MIDPTDEWMTVRETANLLKMSEPTVLKLFREGRLQGRQFGPKTVRILRSSITPGGPEKPGRRERVIDHIGDE